MDELDKPNSIDPPTKMEFASNHAKLEKEETKGRANRSVFWRWFLIALGLQFLAWILMCVARPVRPFYFTLYLPFFYLFPGPHYPRYGLGFFIFFLPAFGSLFYSIIAGFLANFIHRRRSRPR